jgi:sugar lactone lactonase YvrE
MSRDYDEGKGDSPQAGSLYCMDTELRVRRLFGGVAISNGLGWSPDNAVMYYIDSPTRQVAAFDFDPESGDISNKRVAVVIPEDGGIPDGMTVDEDGTIWVAQWGAYQVSRWNPHTGELLQTISVPAANVTCCAFGGPDLEELYITTSKIGVGDEEGPK